jgi:NAD(P)-dependent dehydrogenase (short-subunit alcohol dehydrogenase family)
MELSLKNKTAIITGGASGIGEAISQTFAAAGAHVYILDVREEEAQKVVEAIQEAGHQADFRKADVSNQSEMISICKGIAAESGRIDVMVNNAGIAHVGKLDTTPEADFDRVYAVNVKGVYNGMYAVINSMKTQKSGVILNMASIASVLGLPDRFAYSMSKGAVLNMTLTVARDYLDYNIRCNCIAPARIHTPFVDGFLADNYPGREKEMFEQLSKTQPIGRMGRPEEVAQLALYLCSDAASFITGTNFPIDGGFINLNT